MEMIITYTVISVGIMLAAAAFGSAIGWAMIGAKTLEGIARQPEARSQLMTTTFILGGLMEAFPFIVLALALLLMFANPFIA